MRRVEGAEDVELRRRVDGLRGPGGAPAKVFGGGGGERVVCVGGDNIPTMTVLAHRSSHRDTVLDTTCLLCGAQPETAPHLWACSAQSHEWEPAWCGVVWCGVVWRGVVSCGVVWCGVVWCGVPKALLPNGKRPGCLPKGKGKRAGLCVLCARCV